MTSRSTRPSIITVIREGRVVGLLLERGKLGFEAYDSADRSIGVFESTALAHEAVMRSRAA